MCHARGFYHQEIGTCECKSHLNNLSAPTTVALARGLERSDYDKADYGDDDYDEVNVNLRLPICIPICIPICKGTLAGGALLL
jgi:hypothetical protein